MQRAWRWIKAIAVFIGLGLAAAAVCSRFRLRSVAGSGDRIQGNIEQLGSGIEDISDGVSKAIGDNRELSQEIGSAAAEIRGDIDEAGEIADRLLSADRRAESTLERLEEANRRFAELVGAGDKKK